MHPTSSAAAHAETDMPPEISIVIPAHKAEKTICRAVDSALAQPGVRMSIVVVVDGDFDNTVQTLRRYPEDRVRVMLNPANLGAAETRNKGLAATTSEFVMFLDADDFFEGPLVRGLVEAIQISGADVAFGPMEILYEERGRRAPRFVPDFASSMDIVRKWHLEGLYVNPASVMWRTRFIRGIEGWDPEMTRNDDGELVMRAVLLGAKIAVSSKGTGVYVKHSSETMNHRTDNLPSMLRANEKLLAIDSPWLDKDTQRAICAGHYFNVAWHCYLVGRDDLGDEALSRSRALGFRGSRGPRLYRLLFALLGLRPTVKLVAMAKRLLGRG